MLYTVTNTSSSDRKPSPVIQEIWTQNRDEVYMEGMNSINPPEAGYKKITPAWEKLTDIVNKEDPSAAAFSVKSIKSRYHTLIKDFDRRDKKTRGQSGTNEPYTKLDQLIYEYKGKMEAAKEKKCHGKEAARRRKKKKEESQGVIMERMRSIGPSIVAQGGKGKRKADDSNSDIPAAKRQTASSQDHESDKAIEDYLNGTSSFFSDNDIVQNFRKEIELSMTEQEEEFYKMSEKMRDDIDDIKNTQAQLLSDVEYIKSSLDKITQVLLQPPQQHSLSYLQPSAQ